MPPTFGGTQRLRGLAGRKRALELLLTGDPSTPPMPAAIGLVNRVVPRAEVLETARALAPGASLRHFYCSPPARSSPP